MPAARRSAQSFRPGSRHEPLQYALVTPARNERDNLIRLAESVLAQTTGRRAG